MKLFFQIFLSLMPLAKAPPAVLVAALQPRQAYDWRAKNPLADGIEMVLFTDEQPPRAARLAFTFERFGQAGSDAPWCVVNPPPDAALGLRRLGETGDEVFSRYGNPMARYGMAVMCVAASLKVFTDQIAWVLPESDHAYGACLLTGIIGRCAGLSGRPMIDSLGAMAANREGVDVRTLGSVKPEGDT